jgi:hypothetical protein
MQPSNRDLSALWDMAQAIRDFEDPRRLAQPEDIEAVPLQAAAS